MNKRKLKKHVPQRQEGRVRFPTFLLFTLFFVSGTCGLAYEIVWARMLTLVFGSTLHAIATVLAIFMLGLGLGSHLAGRYVARIRSPLRVYAYTEIMLGGYALVFPIILEGVQWVHSLVFPLVFQLSFILNIVRILLVVGILLIPTVLMGATLPLLSQHLARPGAEAAKWIGKLYAINTLGAAVGSFLSAFVLIPFVGLNWTLFCWASANFFVGGVVIRFASLLTPSETSYPRIATNRATGLALSCPDRCWAISALLVVGIVGMILENAWSHALVLVFGTSVYAFSTMLTTYLIGLGLGSHLMARWASSSKKPSSILYYFIIALGVAIFCTTPIIGRLPNLMFEAFADAKSSWTKIIALEFLLSSLVMLTPTLVGGAIFPLAIRILSCGDKTGAVAAEAYVFNTIGSVVGSLFAGFILIPMVGSEQSLLFSGSISIIFGLVLVSLHRYTSFLRHAAMISLSIAIAMACFIYLKTWNPMEMNSGVYIYSKNMMDSGKKSLQESMSRFSLLYHREGMATVGVFEDQQGQRFLRINGKTDGSDGSDNITQVLLAYLPFLYARELNSALVVGLGTGITSGSILDLPIKSLETIEISPEVVQSAHFFSKLNHGVFSDNRSTIRILDGRTWLLAMPNQYDMITSEPSNPWQTGNANLFTVDFFQLVSKRLKSGGVFCQWLPYYHMDPSHYQLIIRSLAKVFSHINIWLANTDTFILSSNEPLNIDKSRLSYLLSSAKSKDKLNIVGVNTADELLGFFYLDENAALHIAEGVNGYNLDSNPVVEFQSPKYVLGSIKPDIFFKILEFSYNSTLPIQGEQDMIALQSVRILSRYKFYNDWKIPDYVTSSMVYHSTQGR